MPGPRLISVVGKKNSGKTTLVVALVKELVRRGHRVMSIKHGSHPFQVDEEGRDSWRHMHEGGAERVVMETPQLRVLISKIAEPMGPRELADLYLSDAEFVVVEGFKEAEIPKIEVFRKAVHAEPLYAAGTPGAAQFVASVTDDRELRASIPVLRFSDTAWMYRLVDIVLQGAK
jgi:molybdopterin-guanine dinucleotide biosynthesis protein MobB